MAPFTWVYDASARIHRYGQIATVQKVGAFYAFAVLEPPLNYYGQCATLKDAKRAAGARATLPEPTHYTCWDCHDDMVCEVKWAGEPYYNWSETLPGTFQPIMHVGGMAIVPVCAACLDKRGQD